ncbi:MAG: CdaR family protein [Pseudomonadota bacterium]
MKDLLIAFFTRNPLLKVLSLILAALVWWLVHGEQYTEMAASVKLNLKNIPQNMVVAGDFDQEIRLRISGSRGILKRVDERFSKPFTIDLADARQGVNAFTLYAEDFSIPRGTRVTRIVPQVIRITLDQAEERLVRIEPRFVGTLDEGFELAGDDIAPSFVKVRAPRSELEGLGSLRTEPISLNDRHEAFDGVYEIRDFRPQWNLETKVVSVHVKIREKEVSKIIEEVPVRVVGVTQAVQVEPKTVALHLKGPAGKVTSLLGEKLDVLIDGKALNLDKKPKTTFLIRPVPPVKPGVEITMIPDNVRVTVLKD